METDYGWQTFAEKKKKKKWQEENMGIKVLVCQCHADYI